MARLRESLETNEWESGTHISYEQHEGLLAGSLEDDTGDDMGIFGEYNSELAEVMSYLQAAADGEGDDTEDGTASAEALEVESLDFLMQKIMSIKGGF